MMAKECKKRDIWYKKEGLDVPKSMRFGQSTHKKRIQRYLERELSNEQYDRLGQPWFLGLQLVDSDNDDVEIL